MKPIADRNILRAEASVLDALGHAGIATVHEAQSRVGLMKPTLRPVWRGATAAGSAVTVLTHPGDVIVADDDGVVVVPRPKAEAVAKTAAQREANEQKKREALAFGVLGLDRYGMREALASKGLRYSGDLVGWYRGQGDL
jgi:4-hydroxy-4-methyl-2-oxoglutarate aldolase